MPVVTVEDSHLLEDTDVGKQSMVWLRITPQDIDMYDISVLDLLHSEVAYSNMLTLKA